MFKEILKLGFEDLNLQYLMIRGFVDPMNGIVKDMLIIKNDGNYELQCSEDGAFIGFTLDDVIFFGEHFLEIRSNNGDVRRFYKEFRGGLCARFPFTEETLRKLMDRKIDTFHISNVNDFDIAYFDTDLEKSDGLKLHVSDNHLVANLNGHYFELLDTKNAEIRVYSF